MWRSLGISFFPVLSAADWKPHLEIQVTMRSVTLRLFLSHLAAFTTYMVWKVVCVCPLLTRRHENVNERILIRDITRQPETTKPGGIHKNASITLIWELKVGELVSQVRHSFDTNHSYRAIRPGSNKSNKPEAGYPWAKLMCLSVRSLRVQCMHTSHWINFLQVLYTSVLRLHWCKCTSHKFAVGLTLCSMFKITILQIYSNIIINILKLKP